MGDVIEDAPFRGRVVMLVDNAVEGDSRVQKTAESAAAEGWEVILLGERRDSTRTEWKIGRAQVRLIEMDDLAGWSDLQFRRSWVRRPFAYPTPAYSYRRRIMRARWADFRVRQAAVRMLSAGSAHPMRKLLARGGLAVTLLKNRLENRYFQFRASQTRRLAQARRNQRNILNYLPILWWRALLGNRSWRRLDPSLWRWELAFGPVIDELQPDIIHAHDFRMVGVGARAVIRARAQGRDVKLVWDAHEYAPGLRPRPPRWLAAVVAHEREYARCADAVITISAPLAELLRREHKLRQMPAVVMNAPMARAMDSNDEQPVPDLRALCGIDRDVPLLVYCGGITPVRGVDLMVAGLPHLPGVHVALVSLHPDGRNKAADEISALAASLGVADRVHILPYVPHWQVSKFISVADAAVSALQHLPNHEIALSNKFFEYSHARLPLVVSDTRTMAEVVRSTGQGEVFRAGDLEDYVRAVRAVLSAPEKYRSAYEAPGLLESWTWEAQVETLLRVYRRLMASAQRSTTSRVAQLEVGVATPTAAHD